MYTDCARTSPFTDVNGLVADFLDDVAHQPIRHGGGARLTKIRKAVAEGNATVDMALDIIRLFPKSKPGRASD